jgi:polyisoprenoid-binding protein YceI
MAQYFFSKGITGSFIIAGLLSASCFLSSVAGAQTKYLSTDGVKTIINGTSNIHDWDMKSDKGACTAIFNFSPSGVLNSMGALIFSVPAESLKSEHTAMDKNSYKALKTDKYANISFTAVSGTVKSVGGSNYTLVAAGKLTISGVTKDVELTANGTMAADKSIAWNGTYKLKMTDYHVSPPSIMFGTIKTGNDLVVKFNLTLKAE